MSIQYRLRLGNINCSKHTISEFLDDITMLLDNRLLQPRTLLCLNAHIYNIAYRDEILREILNGARIVTADGKSILWASRLFGEKIRERCNMTEAFRAFLQSKDFRKNTGILIGNTEQEARLAGKKIEETSTHCRIIKTFSGLMSESDYRKIFASIQGIDFIFLGMSTPKTEKISEIAKEMCSQAIVWGIGAGTIKIFAGTMKEAPIFWRRAGLQWLYRFARDPITLWHRYLIGNPLFIFRIIKSYRQDR